MKLFLQTSSGQPTLALWDSSVLLDVQFERMQRLDYGQELKKALAKVGRSTADLSSIIVDIGPGRLGSTRTAVAFANGLGFALNIPLIPVNSFILLGVYGENLHARPCLVLRKAAKRQYHWALIIDGNITESGFSTDGTISPKHYSGPVVIAGDAKPDEAALPTLSNTLWTEINAAPASALSLYAPHMAEIEGQAIPLTETGDVVYG